MKPRSARASRGGERGVVTWLGVALLCVGGACAKPPAAPVDAGVVAPAPARTLSVKLASAPVEVDGELEEADWRAAETTGPFPDERAPGAVVAHTEARAVWDDAALTVALYSADEDLGDDDHVDVSVQAADGGSIDWEVPPTARARCRRGGAACGAQTGVRAAADVDGTMNDASDDDEEWAVELAVPWSVLGFSSPPERVEVQLGRVDRVKGGASRRQAWPGVLRLERPRGP